MVFSSVIFLYAFLPLFLLLYFLFPRPARNGLLLAGSLFFYTWGEQVLVFIMLTSTTVDYVCGLVIARGFGAVDWEEGGLPESRTRTQKAALAASVLVNLLLLGVFKYFNFALDNYNGLMAALGLDSLAAYDAMRIVLPLGISFYTFQSMSYTIDVYRGHARADRNFIHFACYVTMFPQLIAGPIVRYSQVARELKDRRTGIHDFAAGVRQFIVGLGKKMLIANVVGEAVDGIFALPADQVTGSLAWTGAGLFALQIYYDFSGYSDMAIGMGRMIGFRFPENFRYPYIAKSMSEFWQRWHMTLSSWLRDYLFIPLGGFWIGRARSCVNLMIVFVLCGIWHGASWNFVVFGFSLGVFITFEHLVRSDRAWFFQSGFGNAYLILVILFNLVIFRTEDLHEAGVFLKAMCGFSSVAHSAFSIEHFATPETLLIFVIGVIGCVPVVPWLQDGVHRWSGSASASVSRCIDVAQQSVVLLWLFGILAWCAMKLAIGTYNPFIYFRF